MLAELSENQVSIPKRVSAKVEPSALMDRQRFPLGVSIPKRVSAKVELGAAIGGATTAIGFQSLKGFQPKWNSES